MEMLYDENRIRFDIWEILHEHDVSMKSQTTRNTENITKITHMHATYATLNWRFDSS